MNVETAQPPRGGQGRWRAWLDVPVQLVRDFVWADVRAGLVDLRGLDTPAHFVVIVGFVLLVCTVAALLFNETWRAQFALVPQSNGAVGRGTLVPNALLPVTFFLMAVAWAYGLAGALHSHWLVRAVVNALYLLFALAWLNSTGVISLLTASTALRTNDYVELGLMVLAMLAVPAVTMVRARRAPSPAKEWLALFVCTAAFFALIHASGIENWREFEVPVIVGNLTTNLSSYQAIVAPLLLLAGVNIALFTNQAARWTTDVADAKLGKNVLIAVVLVLVLWRGVSVAQQVVEDVNAGKQVGPLWGALGVFVIVAASYFLVTRMSRDRTFTIHTLVERVRGVALWLIVVTGAFALISAVIDNLVQATPVWQTWEPVRDALFALGAFFQGPLFDPWVTLVWVVTLGVAVFLARRGVREVALYLLITAGLALWYNLTTPRGLLGALGTASAERIDFIALLILVALAVLWTAAGKMTRARLVGLLFLTVLTGLVRQTDFISSPFSPFLGFAGIGFVAFGILYDAVTAGVWTNSDSAAFPRLGRIFLYVGYVLLGVMIVNWALASHDLNNIEALTGSVAWRGMEIFGLPVLYAVSAITVAPLFTGE